MNLISRAFHLRRELARLQESRLTVEEMTADHLARLGAEGVVFDHDGILSPSRAPAPDAVGATLLEGSLATFGKGKVFVLSNSRSRQEVRARHFSARFPDIPYLLARRKPDPEGLLLAMERSGLPAEKIAMVDDGLLTGGLMAIEGGALPVYATRRELVEAPVNKLIRLGATWPQRGLVTLLRYL